MADLSASPGDSIEVDYSVTNTGELEDTQDIFLTADDGTTTNVDRIDGITLQPSGSDTGTLLWEQAPEGNYTLCVESEDSTDCISVLLYDTPNSVVSRYNPDDLSGSDGDAVSTETDLIGSRDLSATGDPILKTDQIGGQNTVRTDGGGDYLSNASDYVTTDVDFAIIFVYKILESVNSANHLFDGGSDLEFSIQDDNGGQFQAHREGTNNADLGYSPDGTAHIGVLEGFTGGDVQLRIDGDPKGVVGTNDSDLTGLGFGGRFHNDGGYINCDFGEREVLVDYAASDITDEETRLADKYGISV